MSGKAEALSFFDSNHKPLMEDFLAGVLWQVDLVEAGVTTWQAHDVVGLDLGHCKLLRSSHSNKPSEAVEGHLRTACYELQELCTV